MPNPDPCNNRRNIFAINKNEPWVKPIAEVRREAGLYHYCEAREALKQGDAYQAHNHLMLSTGNGNQDAYILLADQQWRGNNSYIPKDVKEAFRTCKELTSKGNCNAAYMRALMLECEPTIRPPRMTYGNVIGAFVKAAGLGSSDAERWLENNSAKVNDYIQSQASKAASLFQSGNIQDAIKCLKNTFNFTKSPQVGMEAANAMIKQGGKQKTDGIGLLCSLAKRGSTPAYQQLLFLRNSMQENNTNTGKDWSTITSCLRLIVNKQKNITRV